MSFDSPPTSTPYHPAPAPTRLRLGSGLELRPLLGRDAVNDLAAVEAARPALLRRSRYRWPRPGFTLAENLADLVTHQIEHERGEALTYTVVERAEGRCVGCVYLRPLRQTLEKLAAKASGDDRSHAETTLATLPPAASDLTFWTVPELHGAGHDRALLRALRMWLARDFAFETVWLVANDAELRVTRLANRLGLPPILTLRTSHRTWHFFELV